MSTLDPRAHWASRLRWYRRWRNQPPMARAVRPRMMIISMTIQRQCVDILEVHRVSMWAGEVWEHVLPRPRRGIGRAVGILLIGSRCTRMWRRGRSWCCRARSRGRRRRRRSRRQISKIGGAFPRIRTYTLVPFLNGQHVGRWTGSADSLDGGAWVEWCEEGGLTEAWFVDLITGNWC